MLVPPAIISPGCKVDLSIYIRIQDCFDNTVAMKLFSRVYIDSMQGVVKDAPKASKFTIQFMRLSKHWRLIIAKCLRKGFS